MNQNRVISLVMNDLENRLHSLDRDGLLLSACHSDVAVSNAIGLHERAEGLGEFFVHQGTDNRSELYSSRVGGKGLGIEGGTYMMVFNPNF